MTTPPCATGCGRPSPNAAICGDCQGELRRALQLAASIATALEEAVARQSAHGGSGRAPSRENPLPVDLGAMAARDHLRCILRGWVLVIAAAPPPPVLPAPTVSRMAAWLEARMRYIAVHDAAPDIHGEVRDAVARAVRVLDPPPERVYAGPCPQCGTDVLGHPGAAQAECGRCRAPVNIGDQQGAMRASMEDMLFTAAQLVSMAKAVGEPVSEFTVRSWIRRHQLVAKGEWRRATMEPSPTYRFGDMLQLAAGNPRRTKPVELP